MFRLILKNIIFNLIILAVLIVLVLIWVVFLNITKNPNEFDMYVSFIFAAIVDFLFVFNSVKASYTSPNSVDPKEYIENHEITYSDITKFDK